MDKWTCKAQLFANEAFKRSVLQPELEILASSWNLYDEDEVNLFDAIWFGCIFSELKWSHFYPLKGIKGIWGWMVSAVIKWIIKNILS